MATRTVEARLIELTARLEQQEAELHALKSERSARRLAAAPDQTSSRRDLFKLAGAGVAGAAATSMLGAQPVAAADGAAILMGTVGDNHATSTTSVTVDSMEVGTVAFQVNAGLATGAAPHVNAIQGGGKGTGSGIQGFGGANGGSGVGATGGDSSGPGISAGGGAPDGTGVYASGAGTGAGVAATGGGNSGNGVGAVGGGPDGHGILAQGVGLGNGVNATGGDTSGSGVFAVGGSGGGNGAQLASGGTGAPLNLVPSGKEGPPGLGAHAVGDVWADSNGILWVCVAGGTAGTWTRVGQVQPSFGAQANAGGVMNLLPNPIRILDTRSGSPYGGGSTHILQVTGAADLNGSSTVVPAGAVAVIGNATVVFPEGAGDLRLFPHGVSLPSTSNLNYNLNVTIANSATVGLDGDGRMDIYVDVSTTHVLFDASGFVI